MGSIIGGGVTVDGMQSTVAPIAGGYGAFAVDNTAHKFGYATHQFNQEGADQLALSNCKSDNCKLVFPIAPNKCGAFAATADGNAWGGAVRPTIAAAQSSAIMDCQMRVAGQCSVRQWACNQ